MLDADETATSAAYLACCREHPNAPNPAALNTTLIVVQPSAPRLAEEWQPVLERERVAQCDLLRDLIGNPFEPTPFEPAWRSPAAVELAARMYASRDFGALPALADALEEAGCTSEEMLGHCRGPACMHADAGSWT